MRSEMSRLRLIFVVNLLLVYHVVLIKSELEKEKMQLLLTFVLHQNYTRCSLTRRGFHETCEIQDQIDATAIGELN